MADENVQPLFLQVDASIELLKRRLLEGEQPLGRFEQRAKKMTESVEASIGSMGSRFGAFAQLAETSAQRAQRSFETSFSQIERAAAKAVKSGGTSLGAGDARAAAAEAQAKAAALGQIEIAAQRAAAGEGVLTMETRNFIAAASAARIEAERHAVELGREAGALERLELEMQQAGAGAQQLADRQRTATASAGALRSGSQQLSFQISDVAMSFATGINPMVIFAQQGSQVVQAISLMRGSAGGLVGFLSGPWGAALLGAVTILGLMATSHKGAAAAQGEHQSAADRLREALERLNGQAAENNRQTRIGIQNDLDAATAARARAVATLQLVKAKLAEANARSIDPTTAGEGGFNPGAVAAAGYARQAANLDKEIADYARPIRIGRTLLAMRDVAAATDAATAATQRYDDALDKLRRDANDGKISEATFRREAERVTRQRDTTLNAIREANKTAPKGPSAERILQRELSEDISFNSQVLQARRRLLDATIRSAVNEEARDQLIRDEIEAEFEAERDKIALQARKGTRDAAEVATLNEINEGTRLRRLENVRLEAVARQFDESFASRAQAVSSDIELLRISQGLAVTNAERERVARLLLQKEQEQARIALEAVRDGPRSTPEEVQRALESLERLPLIQTAQLAVLDRQLEGPLAQYRENLRSAIEETDAALEGVAVDGLLTLEDGLVDIISGTTSVSEAFSNMASSIIADLARIALRKYVMESIANTLPSLFGGGGSGSAGISFFDEVFGAATKRASGGLISGPGGPRSDSILAALSNGEYVINAAATKANLPLLEAINSGRLPRFANGGLVSPRLPNFSGAGSRGDLRLEVSLSDDLNLRIDQRSGARAGEMIAVTGPAIAATARAQTANDNARTARFRIPS